MDAHKEATHDAEPRTVVLMPGNGLEAEPVKKRGRPRKYEEGQSPTEKKRLAAQSGEKRSRGRPKKSEGDVHSPKKVAAKHTAVHDATIVSVPADGEKKRRGRPPSKKNDIGPVEHNLTALSNASAIADDSDK
eukprot:TRINITY_DN1405_c0_g1_i1.p3 TRINITY_DN1405_c0_g1~~TRINITY_DN1405_c0_g1_i1.p3  ORF type:complete len:133 (+),score=64.57 TRINITY_DN1405_c0_g1_i1:286-684(+)